MGPSNTVQLYDLSSDEQERMELSELQPEVLTALRAELQTYIDAAPAQAYCGVSDQDAIELWFKDNEVEPWIDVLAEEDGAEEEDEDGRRVLLSLEYECPSTTTSTAFCVMVDASTALPPPPTSSSSPSRVIKLGNKILPSGG